MTHVELQVEAFVLYPVGRIEAHRSARELAPENGGFVQAALEAGQDFLEAHLLARPFQPLGLIVENDRADVHGGALALLLEEAGVEFGQLLHTVSPMGTGRYCASPAADQQVFDAYIKASSCEPGHRVFPVFGCLMQYAVWRINSVVCLMLEVQKIYTHDLELGMYVANLDRPWLGTPFLLQGFPD